MPIFVAVGFDRRPKERGVRDAIRASHRDYVLTNAKPILCAGALLDDDRSQCGSMYVFEAQSIEDVHVWLRTEPFFAEGIYESMQVREVEVGPLWTVPVSHETEKAQPS